MSRALVYVALIPWLFAACSGAQVRSTPQPSDEAAADEEDEEAEARPAPEESRLDGDEQIGERWRSLFRQWAAKDLGGIFVGVVAARETSDGVTVLLKRHWKQSADAICFEGPTTLRIRQQDGEDPTFEDESWGSHCCPGEPCEPPETALEWNLRYVNAVVAKDRATLASLLPSKGSVAWRVGAAARAKTRKITRKEALKGALDGAAACDFLAQRAECEPLRAASTTFRCQCLGEGSSASFDWKKEGESWVLASIDESSR
jgi:hypothetical protein